MSNLLKVGDHVISKGNSLPKMTIKSIEKGLCNCEWTDNDRKDHKKSFQLDQLEKA